MAGARQRGGREAARAPAIMMRLRWTHLIEEGRVLRQRDLWQQAVRRGGHGAELCVVLPDALHGVRLQVDLLPGSELRQQDVAVHGGDGLPEALFLGPLCLPRQRAGVDVRVLPLQVALALHVGGLRGEARLALACSTHAHSSQPAGQEGRQRTSSAEGVAALPARATTAARTHLLRSSGRRGCFGLLAPRPLHARHSATRKQPSTHSLRTARSSHRRLVHNSLLGSAGPGA